MSSLVIGLSRLTTLAVRSPANRFVSHLHLRNVAISSSGWHSWSGQRPRIDDNGSRHGQEYSVASRFQQHQSVRHFYRDVPQEQTPGKKNKGESQDPTDSSSKASPVDGSSGKSSMQEEEPAKLGLFARFKKMGKEYWYVLVPVHCVTSVFWLGGFYYASKSGVDVIALLESMGVSQKLIDPVRDSSLGHIAVAYLLYKIATPARYTVTLGGTTLSIKYLVQWGYIKPMPSKAKLVQMYKDRKENLQERIAEKKQDFHDRKQQLADAGKKNLQDTMKTIKPKKDVPEPK
ncbi:AAEL011684-PA [Aedes aegypti]|uniref:AAEL011684-PA n=1 Tax=Aedes aegypti TaxID=7159 RepID=Q16PC0_AEDAE|nr:AAEL011684-PA [Aedes aegypti]